MSSRQTFAVLAWYRQFYLFDPNETCATDSSGFWTAEAFECGLAVQPGWIGITTDTNGEVPVTLEIRESEPASSLDAWDRIAEASLLLSGDHLVIASCPDLEPAATIPLGPGSIRVRVSATIPRDREDPGGVEYRGDKYLIQLWRSEVQDRVVLKRFAGGPI